MALVDVTKALADESRIRILGALRRGELCVCQIVELLELAPSTTSKHLSQLKAAGLIASRKSGRWIHYRLANDDEHLRATSAPVVLSALDWVVNSLRTEGGLARDEARLDEILSAPAGVLAARQRDACCGPVPDSPGAARSAASIGAEHRKTGTSRPPTKGAGE